LRHLNLPPDNSIHLGVPLGVPFYIA
jgi:hypothetical protein